MGFSRFTILLASVFMLSVPVSAQAVPTSTAQHVLNLDDVEITALIDDVSIITGYTFVLHPDVRRTRVTVTSQSPMSTEEVFQVFLSTLRVHGFAATPAGRGVYRIVPEQVAVGEASTSASSSNTFVTEVMRLDNFNAVEAAQMIKPMVDAQGQVVANSGANSLVVVDYASNMPRLRSIVKGLDESGRREMTTLQLTNVPAREMRDILQELIVSRDGNAMDQRFSVTASQTSNAIIMAGSKETVAKALRVAQELDESDRVQDTLRVIALTNSDAVDIVPILERLAESMSNKDVAAEQGAAATISHHEPTNSLIISAPPDVLIAMERVVESLDRRRAQVLVEAIIVEISDDAARELGVQFLLAGAEESSVPFLSTNFSRSAPNLLTLAGAIANPADFGGTNPFTEAAVSSLLNLGPTAGIGGRSGDTLFGAVLTALETDRNSQVLSKPFNMTLDNGTSQLIVGQEVPITTGEVLGDANSNPFRTTQREQVGIKLEVTPRISADDTIRLDIFQEVSSLDDLRTLARGDVVTNTREITTSVLADDGEIIVIGGLIERRDLMRNEKVPLLGDVPVVGNLFKSEGREYQRTNLMVFIRPTIVRDRDDARSVTSRNYRYLRAESILRDGEKGDTSTLDDFIAETLGAEPPRD